MRIHKRNFRRPDFIHSNLVPMERYTFDFHVQNKHVTHTIYRGYESNEVKKTERERENRSFDTLCQKYTTKSSNTQKETISTAF